MATLELKQVRKNYGNLEVIHGIDLFINNDKQKILHNSRITYNGNLTPRFRYLIDYIND